MVEFIAVNDSLESCKKIIIIIKFLKIIIINIK